ncbi:NAD-dependent epimerase/dehydratase family protein [Microvirga sp. CF3016]|uniref:NAD-dependent epimerase/dehydratase family protein n=1 Tax=Microvirga sp. CF3016 TaxID=3110181 RepID=UPI002E784825|nr:NAD(P)-dependent oxidoreductase [Microvirga sp. CF3016]MEE1613506.1 NAD(P)-dependent oxidoreductase [Microvirga sp. CF3016]
MTSHKPVRSVLITGAGGNLGRKLMAHLLAQDWCERIVALDRAIPASPISEDRVQWVAGNLADPSDVQWHGALAGIGAAVHFAAQNPYPDAAWSDACASFDMTLALLGAAGRAGLQRIVFASSNHVMGQYKDAPLADSLTPGGLTTSLAPGPGTRWFNGREMLQGTAYAASKLMGERACLAEAHRSRGALTAICVRIGWCQPGENRPETINTSGLPGEETSTGPDTERDLRWFRNMWLSNRDFTAVMERALLADTEAWPQPGIVVNGMSANRGMPWDVETTRRLIGYEPQDDIWDHVA